MQTPNILYLGIDVAKHQHQAVMTNQFGQPLGESFSFDNSLQGFGKLAEQIKKHSGSTDVPLVKVGIESTGNYWQHLARFLKSRGCEIYLVNPIETQEIAKTSIRQVKNDKVDAGRIIKLVQTKKYPIWVLSEQQLKLRKLTRLSFRLQRQISFLAEQIINVLDTICPELQGFFKHVFQSKTALSLLNQWPDLRKLDRVREQTFIEFLRKNSKGHVKKDKALKILSVIRDSIGKSQRDEYSALELSMLMSQFRQLVNQLNQIKTEAINLAQRFCPESFKWINSVIGVSEYMTSVMLAEIGEINKFEKSKQLVAFSGLDPSVKQSGRYTRRHGNHISKRGSKYLRRELYFAAKASIMFDPELRQWYEKKKAQGKHYNVCMCAIARKILLRIWACWKQEREYQVKQVD